MSEETSGSDLTREAGRATRAINPGKFENALQAGGIRTGTLDHPNPNDGQHCRVAFVDTRSLNFLAWEECCIADPGAVTGLPSNLSAGPSSEGMPARVRERIELSPLELRGSISSKSASTTIGHHWRASAAITVR